MGVIVLPTSTEDGYDFTLDTKPIRVIWRRLIVAGYTHKEAGNFIAHIMGLPPSEKGWTLRELQYLHFLQYLDKREPQ